MSDDAMEMLLRVLFVVGYVLLVPSLTVFWYTGGRRMERAQSRSLWVMGLGVALVLLSSQPYR